MEVEELDSDSRMSGFLNGPYLSTRTSIYYEYKYVNTQ